jgi:hypothetical protein
VWLWKGLGVAWPGLGRRVLYQGPGRLLEEVGRWILAGPGLLWLVQQLVEVASPHPCWPSPASPSLGCLVSTPQVRVEQDEQGVYHVGLRGEFSLHLDGKDEFCKRMLCLFLGQWEVEGVSRGSRRTRDGRTPLIRRQQLAQWLAVPQPVISHWCGYWLRQDWRRLLSQKTPEALTLEVQQRIIETWTQFPCWGAQRLWQHLNAQGECTSLSQVQQAAHESG